MNQARYRLVMLTNECPQHSMGCVVDLCHEHYDRVIDETMTSDRVDIGLTQLFVFSIDERKVCHACKENHPFMLDGSPFRH